MLAAHVVRQDLELRRRVDQRVGESTRFLFCWMASVSAPRLDDDAAVEDAAAVALDDAA